MTSDPILDPPHGGEGWRGEIAATLALAGPLVVANLAQMLVYAVDVIFVARLGAETLAAASLATTLLMPSVWLASLCFFLLGAGPIVWTIATTTLRQNITADALLGRVSAVFLTANTGARPIGAALGGLIGAHWGESACLTVALAGFILQAIVITCSCAAALRQMPASPA